MLAPPINTFLSGSSEEPCWCRVPRELCVRLGGIYFPSSTLPPSGWIQSRHHIHNHLPNTIAAPSPLLLLPLLSVLLGYFSQHCRQLAEIWDIRDGKGEYWQLPDPMRWEWWSPEGSAASSAKARPSMTGAACLAVVGHYCFHSSPTVRGAPATPHPVSVTQFDKWILHSPRASLGF